MIFIPDTLWRDCCNLKEKVDMNISWKIKISTDFHLVKWIPWMTWFLVWTYSWTSLTSSAPTRRFDWRPHSFSTYSFDPSPFLIKCRTLIHCSQTFLRTSNLELETIPLLPLIEHSCLQPYHKSCCQLVIGGPWKHQDQACFIWEN